MLAAAASTPPAGGAETAQVIGATLAASLLTLALLWFGFGHRSGRTALLGRLGRFSEVTSGLPGWASLPSAVAAVSLVIAAIGMYWDISLHIDNGRDPGPLANPSHYFILAGLFGIFAAGWFAIVLPLGTPGRAAIRITDEWRAPVGGILLMAAGGFGLLGFPLDDVWHRLFGQDVTLWGPTHLMLITGGGLALVGVLALQIEGRESARNGSADGNGGAPMAARGRPPVRVPLLGSPRGRAIASFGGLLIGLSVYQGELDFGVPQFRLAFHPMLIAMAGSVALVGARLVAGRGAALGAALVFCGIRGAFALLVGPGLGETVPHFPLFLAEAALVEVAALALGTGRPYRFGLASGALIGSIGVLAELGWSHLWMPIAWPASMLGEAIGFALPVALAGGVLGAFLGSALKLRAELVATPAAVGSALASLVVIGSVAAVLLQTEVPRATAEVELRELSPGPSRTVEATVTLEPASAAEDADWLGVMAWQGQERLFLDPLERGADGRWRSNRPIPVHDSWKAAIRLQNGTRQGAVPLYMPADPAIPVAGVPAEERMTREFASNPDFFQRERKQDVPGWLWAAGIFVVVALWAALLVLLGWGLVRISGGRRIAGWHRRSHGSHGGASVGPGRRVPAPQPQRWRPSP